MQFENRTGKTVILPLQKGVGVPPDWYTLADSDFVDLPESVGLAHGLTPIVTFVTEEGTSPNAKPLPKPPIGAPPEKKPEIDPMFEIALHEIKGLGAKTIKDILEVFPTLELLNAAIAKGEKLPFRDDVEKKLRKAYG